MTTALFASTTWEGYCGQVKEDKESIWTEPEGKRTTEEEQMSDILVTQE